MSGDRWRMAMRTACGALIVFVIGIQAPSAGAAGFALEKSFGLDGTNLSGFSSATSVAVDQEEEVLYVLDRKADALFKFDLEGNPVDFGGTSPNISGNELSGLSIGDSFGARQVAVDPASHTIYLPGQEVSGEWGGGTLQAFHSNGEESLFSAGPGAGTNEIPGFAGLRGIAVDSNGNIYTGDRGNPTEALEADVRIYRFCRCCNRRRVCRTANRSKRPRGGLQRHAVRTA